MSNAEGAMCRRIVSVPFIIGNSGTLWVFDIRYWV